jgi:aminoglycoside/choline kinase family phosphotransferase
METTSRAQARLDWTRQALGDPAATLERASADASFRSYWRTASGGRSWIVMDAPPDREDVGRGWTSPRAGRRRPARAASRAPMPRRASS